MFSQIIAGKSLPRHLSSDHDPLFRFHRWLGAIISQPILGGLHHRYCRI
jgi:hypothetical protein